MQENLDESFMKAIEQTLFLPRNAQHVSDSHLYQALVLNPYLKQHISDVFKLQAIQRYPIEE